MLPGKSLFSPPKPPKLPKAPPPPPPPPARHEVPVPREAPPLIRPETGEKRVGRMALILSGSQGDLEEVPLGRPTATLGE